MRKCLGRKGAGGLTLIAAGVLLLAFSLPIQFWTALLGAALITTGVLLLKMD